MKRWNKVSYIKVKLDKISYTYMYSTSSMYGGSQMWNKRRKDVTYELMDKSEKMES